MAETVPKRVSDGLWSGIDDCALFYSSPGTDALRKFGVKSNTPFNSVLRCIIDHYALRSRRCCLETLAIRQKLRALDGYACSKFAWIAKEGCKCRLKRRVFFAS